MTGTDGVMAIGSWKNNAELIADCARLGYLRSDWHTLDPTYGLGRFWSIWRPDHLTASDLNPERSPGPPADFTALPHPEATFDAVVFDPPYKLNGTPSDPDIAYGVDVVASWRDRHQLIRDGITECARVTSPEGHLLVKCQDQVVSGAVRWQTHEFTAHAAAHGCRLVDQLHLRSYRPQPAGRRQVHARRNYSTLLVLQKAAS